MSHRREPRWKGSDITVVTATIPGREDMLRRCRESVAEQITQPAAHVVYSDSARIGAWWARNQALAMVRTALVALVDDDDELLPAHLLVLLRALNRRPDVDLVFSYPEFPDSRDPLACCYHGKLVASPRHVPFGAEQRDHLDARKSKRCPHCGYDRGNFIPLGYLVKMSAIRALDPRRGVYFPKPRPGAFTSAECEDFLFLLGLLDKGALFWHVEGAVTWRYRVHGANTGGRGKDRLHELAQ